MRPVPKPSQLLPHISKFEEVLKISVYSETMFLWYMHVSSYRWWDRELAETSCLWTVVIDMICPHLERKHTFTIINERLIHILKVNNKLTLSINENIIQKWKSGFSLAVSLRSVQTGTFSRQNWHLVSEFLKLISVTYKQIQWTPISNCIRNAAGTENGQVSNLCQKTERLANGNDDSPPKSKAKNKTKMTCISASDSVSVVGDEEQSACVLCSKTLGGESVKPNNTEGLFAPVTVAGLGGF